MRRERREQWFLPSLIGTGEEFLEAPSEVEQGRVSMAKELKQLEKEFYELMHIMIERL
jgi:hypothetical protein